MILQIGILMLIVIGSLGNFDFTEPSILEVTTGSFSDCTESCDARVLCLNIYYDRRLKICVLYRTGSYQILRQFPRYVKDSSLKNEQKNVTGCDGCSQENCARVNDNYTCIVTVCPPQITPHDAVILGNSNAVGSQKYYECRGDTNGKYRIKCQTDGSWSQQNISGETRHLCSLQSYSISFGRWKAERFNRTHFFADVTCFAGYDLCMPEVALCNAKTGTWFGLGWICCEKFSSSIGLKVFNYPAYTSGNVFQKYKYGENFESNGYRKWCMYRNASFFDNWVNQNIDTVTVRILQSEEVVANLTFNGTGSTHMNWFAKQRLKQSSWHDLDDSTETQIFSISGINTPLKTQRFLISENTEQNENCWNDKIWLSINWSDFPCGNTSTYGAPRIIYAKDNTVSRLIVDDVGFADILDVWISPIP